MTTLARSYFASPFVFSDVEARQSQRRSWSRIFFRFLFAAIILVEMAGTAGLIEEKTTYTWFGLAMTAVAVWAILEVISYLMAQWYGRSLPAITWFVVLIPLSFDFFGDLLHWYESFVWYDQMMHFIGGAAVAACLFILFALRNKERSWTPGQISLIIAWTTALGALYEIEEYLEDFFMGSHRLGDGPDTANDLLMDLGGGLAIVVVLVVYHYARQTYVGRTLRLISSPIFRPRKALT